MSDPIASLQSNRYDVFRLSVLAVIVVSLAGMLLGADKGMVDSILTAIGSVASVALMGANAHDAVVRREIVQAEARKAIAGASGDLARQPSSSDIPRVP